MTISCWPLKESQLSSLDSTPLQLQIVFFKGTNFAIIGAWLIYQYQNKGATGKHVLENMYHKVAFRISNHWHNLRLLYMPHTTNRRFIVLKTWQR
ncbi:hypothetical protein L6452_20089 [Arctium lappa]|uniref:Uncharacterized protein n=1 Tax=Arctium lappa TaxID=4217 RepID=A0ACB9BAF9_ARCLA|nr:hypothetical protein L6452_20089 [Arctium lappa]